MRRYMICVLFSDTEQFGKALLQEVLDFRGYYIHQFFQLNIIKRDCKKERVINSDP